MMQTAKDGPRFDAPEGVNRSPDRRILVQGQVCSAPIVVARIKAQQMEEMALPQDNHVVQTATSGDVELWLHEGPFSFDVDTETSPAPAGNRFTLAVIDANGAPANCPTGHTGNADRR